MGSCLSKKGSPSSSPTKDTGTGSSASSKDIAVDTNQGHRKVIPVLQQVKEEEAAPQEEASGFAKRKEVFIIKHRKSHDRAPPESEKLLAAEPEGSGESPVPEVKAMSKEDEVDAILLQCGRLSHSNSRNSGGRKYSGSKRSYDFDHPNSVDAVPADIPSSDFTGDDERQLRRSQGSRSRRRTPSRERDQQRSGSRERIPGSRRVSRSPARRSETNQKPAASTESNKPGKIVSVPATVSSMVGNTGEATVRRVTVKRNVNVNSEAAPRTAVPSPRPRSQSPARRQAQQQQQQQPTLSRSSSKKAEQSPLRRNPLSEIDTNKLATCKSTAIKEKPKNEIDDAGAAEKQTPRKLTRSRSSRRTFDNLEFNPLEILPTEATNPTSSYTALLLEDIQNFHQKNTTPAPTTPPVTLPPCVTKAHSIYQAVADLNSSISHEEKASQTSQASSYQYSTNRFEFKSSSKDPFVESAVVADDDLLEPSFHKYVTVKRGSIEGDRDEIESSGSNSFMGGGVTPIQQQNWDLPSEPGSVDSSDCWTSRSNTTTDLGNDGRNRKMNVKNREQHPSAGGGRGRVQCR